MALIGALVNTLSIDITEMVTKTFARMTSEAREACETFKCVGLVVVDDYLIDYMRAYINALIDSGWHIDVDETTHAAEGKVELIVDGKSFVDGYRWSDEQ